MPVSKDNPGRVPAVRAPGQQPGRGARHSSRQAGRPLPDAQAIRGRIVPEVAPPYDDVVRAGSAPSGEVPGPDGGGNAFPPAGRAVAQATSATGTWPSQFAQVLSETLAGSRPASQLTPWTTEQARRRISQLRPVLAPRGAAGGRPPGPAARGPRVRRVIVTSPAPGVLEMTVIVDMGSRARAVAVRLERPSARGDGSARAQPDARAHLGRGARTDGWLCTAVEAA
jgi:hypothetical protein